jgi:hypothetical protein
MCRKAAHSSLAPGSIATEGVPDRSRRPDSRGGAEFSGSFLVSGDEPSGLQVTSPGTTASAVRFGEPSTASRTAARSRRRWVRPGPSGAARRPATSPSAPPMRGCVACSPRRRRNVAGHELTALRWRDVDFPGSAIRVRASYTNGHLTSPKSGKVRSVPMASQVAEVLARLGQREFFGGDDDLVFAGIVGGYLDGSALSKR